MVPSVDRVGRYFPLTLVAELPHDIESDRGRRTASAAFFESAERLVIDTLATEDIDFERFDAAASSRWPTTSESSPCPRARGARPGRRGDLDGDGQTCVADADWRDGGAARAGVRAAAVAAFVGVYEPLVLWWTEGSSAVEPSCLIAKGLPHPGTFGALLDGSWEQSSVALGVGARRYRPRRRRRWSITMDAAGFRSAAASDVGVSRETNEDAFVERPEIGLWAVADGLGGHRDGEVASQMVCDALAELVPHPSFEGTIEAVRQR